jgi:hypothetical protein
MTTLIAGVDDSSQPRFKLIDVLSIRFVILEDAQVRHIERNTRAFSSDKYCHRTPQRVPYTELVEDIRIQQAEVNQRQSEFQINSNILR